MLGSWEIIRPVMFCQQNLRVIFVVRGIQRYKEQERWHAAWSSFVFRLLLVSVWNSLPESTSMTESASFLNINNKESWVGMDGGGGLSFFIHINSVFLIFVLFFSLYSKWWKYWVLPQANLYRFSHYRSVWYDFFVNMYWSLIKINFSLFLSLWKNKFKKKCEASKGREAHDMTWSNCHVMEE